MDFGSLLHYAVTNTVAASKKEVKCYKTTYSPAKKPPKTEKAKQLSSNIQKFLEKRDAEEKQKEMDAKSKRDELLMLRSKDRKANKRVQAMLKRTKSANKSVMEDATDNNNTSVTLSGMAQPDEDDYGYVSQEAAALYDKLLEKCTSTPSNEPKFNISKGCVKDLQSTKDRVKMALLKQKEEELLPHKRKRKSQKDEENGTKEGNQSPKHESQRKEDEDKREPKSEEKKFKKPLPKNNQVPPPLDFREILELAAKKQFEPVQISKVAKEEENQRPMTQKQKEEYLRLKERILKKEGKLPPDFDKRFLIQQLNTANKRAPRQISRMGKENSYKSQNISKERISDDDDSEGEPIGSDDDSESRNKNTEERSVGLNKSSSDYSKKFQDTYVERLKNYAKERGDRDLYKGPTSSSMREKASGFNRRQNAFQGDRNDNNERKYMDERAGSSRNERQNVNGIYKNNRNVDKFRSEEKYREQEVRNSPKINRNVSRDRRYQSEERRQNYVNKERRYPSEEEKQRVNRRRMEDEEEDLDQVNSGSEDERNYSQEKGDYSFGEEGSEEEYEERKKINMSGDRLRRNEMEYSKYSDDSESDNERQSPSIQNRMKETKERKQFPGDIRNKSNSREQEDRWKSDGTKTKFSSKEGSDRYSGNSRYESAERKTIERDMYSSNRMDDKGRSRNAQVIDRFNQRRKVDDDETIFGAEPDEEQRNPGDVRHKGEKRNSEIRDRKVSTSKVMENSKYKENFDARRKLSDSEDRPRERKYLPGDLRYKAPENEKIVKKVSSNDKIKLDRQLEREDKLKERKTFPGDARNKPVNDGRGERRIPSNSKSNNGEDNRGPERKYLPGDMRYKPPSKEDGESRVPEKKYLPGDLRYKPPSKEDGESRVPEKKYLPGDLRYKPPTKEEIPKAKEKRYLPGDLRYKPESENKIPEKEKKYLPGDLRYKPSNSDQDNNRSKITNNFKSPIKTNSAMEKESLKPRPQMKNQSTTGNKPVPKQFPPPDVRPRQFPPPDVRPRQFPPPDVRRRQFPPRDVRRSKPPVKRRIESDDERDSEMDDFIDDDEIEDGADYSNHIKEIFGYDKSRYRFIDEGDDECMESNFEDQLKEEFHSAKSGYLEDLEDIRMEKIEKARKHKKMELMKKRRIK